MKGPDEMTPDPATDAPLNTGPAPTAETRPRSSGPNHIAVPAAEICRGVIRMMHRLGLATVAELTLANGRRADVVGLDGSGQLTIVEIKSCLNDFRTDGKWPEYRPYCDRFFFAVSDAFPAEILPGDAGLIVADGFGGAIVRDAPGHKIAPARRKAMTLRFARLAAARLNAPHLSGMDAGAIVT